MVDSDSTVYPLEAVRRFVLYAQKLNTPNGAEPEVTREAIAELVEQLACVQIDTLQRVQRSHYLTVWSRLGSYDPADLDALVYASSQEAGAKNKRQLFEYWFHAACLLPLGEYRYRLQRMQASRHKPRERRRRWLEREQNQELLRYVHSRIEREGALLARDFEHAGGGGGTWWNWKPAKSALEYLFDCGDLLIANRENFQRAYDLAERVLPDWVDRSDPGVEATKRHVLERTMMAAGICAQNQLADYAHDFSRTSAKGMIETLLQEGVFKRVSARLHNGKVDTLILHRDRMLDLQRCAEGEIKAERTTFLNPFDPFFYPRGRDEQFWGFRQVLEAYKPVEKRIWGYYCLPILHGAELIGRFDPRLDRQANRLHLEALYLEPGVKVNGKVIRDVAESMRDFMRFHDAEELVVERSEPADFGEQLLKKVV
jgi:uncharacterized protein YcaQ